jgi:hypothetical protein
MNFSSTLNKIFLIRQLLWCFFALSLLIFSLGISWQVSKAGNFFYGFWYQTLQINTVITKHVPKNTQGKRDFPMNDSDLHAKKFADIVQAIHQQGQGLADIRYVNHQAISQGLLTNAEVQHLQDVANLLDNVDQLWWGNLLLFIAFLAYYCRNKKYQTQFKHKAYDAEFLGKMPTGKQKLISLACFILLLVSILSLWGFTDVFYYLHTVIFPVDHQWFFYYNDSLMATIMKAPDIFAAIAMQLAVVGLLIAVGVDAMITQRQ